ncbi:MAG: prepilin-type N-terminal cleavage/methylation domain-containing protein [Candidatus Magasanikbacteria bacterium]
MDCLSKIKKNNKAFTLLESVVSIAIFVIFVFGIYGGLQLTYKIIYASRIQILETAILNEQMEIIRNMNFEDVGIVSSTPIGILTRKAYIIRNDVEFEVTRTMRIIDDPADGTLEAGTDTSPTDYKLVYLEAICRNCQQKEPVSITSYVSSSFPESSEMQGALFVEVRDANNVPMQGVNVHVYSNNPAINIDMEDTTDNDGLLKIYGLDSCYKCYEVNVYKGNNLTATTYAQGDFGVSIPLDEHASISPQEITKVFLQIDQPSSINVETVNQNCEPVENVDVTVSGGQLLAHTSDVFSLESSVTSDVNGSHILSNLFWGQYNFNTTNYNLIGSIPAESLNILSDSSQSIKLVVGNATRSLSILVRDINTQLPISSAKVTLTSGVYTENQYTGLGYLRQDVWSNSGYNYFDSNNGYYSSNFVAYDSLGSPNSLKLTEITPGLYNNSGYLESATFDFQNSSVDYVKIDWWPLQQPVEVGENAVKFQIATSNSSTPSSWDYLGPDGTNVTYYDLTAQDINTIHDGQRYLRYKLFLNTTDITFTPNISSVDIFYVNNCSLPGQAYFKTIPNINDNEITIEASGYELKQIDALTIDNNIYQVVELNSI